MINIQPEDYKSSKPKKTFIRIFKKNNLESYKNILTKLNLRK